MLDLSFLKGNSWESFISDNLEDTEQHLHCKTVTEFGTSYNGVGRH